MCLSNGRQKNRIGFFDASKALAFCLGFFSILLFSLGAEENSIPVSGELTAGTGTLWIDDEGTSLYWNSGLTLNFAQHFFLNFDVGKVSSSLPWMDTSVLGFMGRFGVDMSNGGFSIAIGSFKQSPINTEIGEITLTNQGGEGFFFGVAIPLHFGALSISPNFLCGNASWDDGDLYYFFGKPNISFLGLYGLDINYNYQDRYMHGLGLRWLFADPGIFNNENESLFNSHLNGGLFTYLFSMEKSNTRFSGTAGWLFVNASLDGTLNTSNQPYFLFPYLFYNVNAFTKIHAGFALLGFRYNWRIFRININLGAFHIFYGNGEIQTDYQKKKLFGGEKTLDKIDLDISGLGAAVLLIEAGFFKLPLGKTSLSLGLRKVFAFPWGYKKLFARDSSDISTGAGAGTGTEVGTGTGSDTFSLIKSVLFSGLSIQGSLSW
jgi:hypothetical protein